MSKLMFLVLFFPIRLYSQHVVTTDLDNFWQALDSVRSVKDTTLQSSYIRRMYLDKASEGLHAFLCNKEGIDKKLVDLINADPLFWDSVRIKSLKLKAIIPKIEENLKRYQALYSDLKPSKIFFLIGIRQQGGTIRNNLSLIGTEVILGNTSYASVDDWISLCIHEYTHTQQKRPDFQKIDVLTSSIREGACDFIAELVTLKKINATHMDYGQKHEHEVFSLFRQEMFTNRNDNWVSTGDNPHLLAQDLGYYVGYRICENYYRKKKDKQQALRDIIELDYADTSKVRKFLNQSRLFPVKE